MNDQEPHPPAGLSVSESYRWITAYRHLMNANDVKVNTLDPAERTLRDARLRATLDDLLRLCGDLSKQRGQQPLDGPSDVF